jgi:hypothetical protein
MKMIYIIIGIILVGGLAFYLTSCNIKQTSSDQCLDSNKVKKTKVQENPYPGLRGQSLSVTPDQLQLMLDDRNTSLYGIVMDWDIGEAVATVVAFQTGDASLYISTGQIYIGGYAHENIRSAALVFLREGQKYLKNAVLTTETPLPDKGCVRFYFLTNKGKYFLQETEENIESKKSDLTNLFDLGNRVITEYRITTE